MKFLFIIITLSISLIIGVINYDLDVYTKEETIMSKLLLESTCNHCVS